MTQAEYEYARAIYTEGSVDSSIVEEPFYNDVLVVHALALTTDFRGLGLEVQIIRKIADTLGYYCAAIVFDPDRAGITEDDELELIPAKSSSLSALIDF